MSKHGVISGPYFPVFGPNAGKYGPETTSYLDIFQAVKKTRKRCEICSKLTIKTTKRRL